jgi:hypothetical protein
MASINTTYEYSDSLDGDALVCSAHGPPEYRSWCIYTQFVLGVWFSIVGMLFLYNARRLGRLVGIAAGPHQERASLTRKRARDSSFTQYFRRLTYVFGIEFSSWGCAHLLGGHGTLNAATSASGLVSEFAFAVAAGCTVYQGLLQLRGAAAFKGLVRMPGDDAPHRTHVAHTLDFAQSVVVFPILLGLCGLLGFGIISRPEYYVACYLLPCAAGVRSLIENILNRMRTLVLVDKLQQSAVGDSLAKQRRRKVLQQKVRRVIVDMTMIFLINVFIPLFVIVSGAVKSSAEWLIQSSIINTLAIFPMSIMAIRTHRHVTSKLRRVNVATSGGNRSSKAMTGSTQDNFTVANESGLSVVGESEVGTRGSAANSQREPGLFGEVESGTV